MEMACYQAKERIMWKAVLHPRPLLCLQGLPHLTSPASFLCCLQDSALGSSAPGPPGPTRLEALPSSCSHSPGLKWLLLYLCAAHSMMWKFQRQKQPLPWALCMPNRVLAHGGHVINSCWHGLCTCWPCGQGFTCINESNIPITLRGV